MLSNSPEKTGKRFTAVASSGTTVIVESRWPKSKGNFITGAATDALIDVT